MPNKIFYVELTQDERYDLGNIKPRTHFMVYDQTAGIAVDITADVKQAPLLSAVPRMNLQGKEAVEFLEQLIRDGIQEKPSFGDDAPKGIRNFRFRELESCQPVADAMAKLKDADASWNNAAELLKQYLLSSGVIKPAVAEPEYETFNALNPASLPVEQRRRLSNLLDDFGREHLLADIAPLKDLLDGNAAESRRYGEKELELRFREIESGECGASASIAAGYLEDAWRINASRQLQERIARHVFGKAQEEKDFVVAIRMAEFLNLPSDVTRGIRVRRFFDAMTADYGYPLYEDMDFAQIIREAASGLPDNVVADTANRAFSHLIGSKALKQSEDISDNFVSKAFRAAINAFGSKGFAESEMEHHYSNGGSVYLRAGLIAREFALGKDKETEAADSLIAYLQIRSCHIHCDMLEEACAKLDIPQSKARQLMSGYFEQSLGTENQRAKRIAADHNLPLDEQRRAVNAAYDRFIAESGFGFAYRMKRDFPELVEDKRFTLDDLKALEGVSLYSRCGEGASVSL